MMQEHPHILLELKIMIRDHTKSEARAPKIFLDYCQLSQSTMQLNEIMKLRQFLAL